MLIAIYFLYLLKKLFVNQFFDVELNKNINHSWKEIIEILPAPCIICPYGKAIFEYSNKAAISNFGSPDSVNSIRSSGWKVYKHGSEGISIDDWLVSNDLERCYIRNTTVFDTIYEAQGVKITYENH